MNNPNLTVYKPRSNLGNIKENIKGNLNENNNNNSQWFKLDVKNQNNGFLKSWKYYNKKQLKYIINTCKSELKYFDYYDYCKLDDDDDDNNNNNESIDDEVENVINTDNFLILKSNSPPTIEANS